MNYNGTLLNGTLFDSSYTTEKPWPAGDPFNFTLGAGQVIKG
jgi:FKBP-type peptidyl-prolyl cis-trans isomerase